MLPLVLKISCTHLKTHLKSFQDLIFVKDTLGYIYAKLYCETFSVWHQILKKDLYNSWISNLYTSETPAEEKSVLNIWFSPQIQQWRNYWKRLELCCYTALSQFECFMSGNFAPLTLPQLKCNRALFKPQCSSFIQRILELHYTEKEEIWDVFNGLLCSALTAALVDYRKSNSCRTCPTLRYSL